MKSRLPPQTRGQAREVNSHVIYSADICEREAESWARIAREGQSAGEAAAANLSDTAREVPSGLGSVWSHPGRVKG